MNLMYDNLQSTFSSIGCLDMPHPNSLALPVSVAYSKIIVTNCYFL